MNTLLPVVEHTLTVYKTWYGYRDHFPKKARYTLGDKIDTRFLNVLELISIAAYQGPEEKLPTLERTIMGIDVLKFLLRVAWELHILDDKKYEILSDGVQKMGQQVGSWRNGLKKKKTPS